jgi:dephospho-CoA kinase
MMLIGVVGGIASGKSEVAGHLKRLGAEVLDADQIGHEVLQEPEVAAAIRRRWGPEVFDSQGRVDRRRLADIVFAPPPRGPEDLAYLEQLTHPRIGERVRARLDELARTGRTPAAVLDAALMIEAGWARSCDCLLFVDAPREQRLARAQHRGWTAAEFSARESAQTPLDVKRSQAAVVIDNSHTLEQTFAEVDRFWRSRVAASR